MTRLFHRTPAGDQILADGFRDRTGSYMMPGLTLAGVWLPDCALDGNEGAGGGDLLEVALPDDVELAPFEVIEDGKPYREWCVPAALVNERAAVRLMSEDEEDAL